MLRIILAFTPSPLRFADNSIDSKNTTFSLPEPESAGLDAGSAEMVLFVDPTESDIENLKFRRVNKGFGLCICDFLFYSIANLLF